MNSKRIIVTVSGWKNSGKDVFADYIVKHYNFKKLALADILKDQVSTRYSIPRHYFDDRDKKDSALLNYPVCADHSSIRSHLCLIDGKYYHTPRSICILESEFVKTIYPNVWVNHLIDKVSSFPEDTRIVISDVRFPVEMNLLKSKFQCISIRVNRFDFTPDTDISERYLDRYPFDILLTNKTTLQDYLANIDDLLVDILS